MITNISKNALLAGEVKLCSSILSKATGLMFQKKLYNKAYLFEFPSEARIGIHMLFVFQNIDILFLDEDMKVVERKESLKPFEFYNPSRKAMYIVELPEGVIELTNTELGDTISFKNR